MAKEKSKAYSEAELIKVFKLIRMVETQTEKMQIWLDADLPNFDAYELRQFESLHKKALRNIAAWSEEDLKMKFISGVLPLGYLEDNEPILTFFEKTIFAIVEGHLLTTKTDFMVAKGILDSPETPYFHFQEYKPHKKPSGDSMAQLLEAMLIAQALNHNEKLIYGCEVIGERWRFVILEGKTYCISKAFDCTEKEELLKIIAILRKFRHILETELLDD
ncbi:MAG: hypothetical protein ACKVTZ_04380 [Bacteroidia bacterium]